MTTLTLLLFKIVACVTISFFVIWQFRAALNAILTETCGTPQRAEFWLTFTQLMLVISPLLIVIFYASTDPLAPSIPALMLKEVLFQTLLGIFIALVLVARVIWKAIPNSQDRDNSNGESPRSI